MSCRPHSPLGPPGVGKPDYDAGLARALTESGYRTYFTTAADFAARFHRAAREGRWATTMRFLAGPTCLDFDELGDLPCRPKPRPLSAKSDHSATSRPTAS